MTFQSFESAITAVCKHIKLASVLEFGPGSSTECFLRCSDASITSIETDKKWYDLYVDQFQNEPRASLHYRVRQWNQEALQREFPDRYDVIFIDGGDRIASLYYGRNLNPRLVILHDSHRSDYFWGVVQYNFLLPFDKHTLLLTDSPDVLRCLSNHISPNTSHQCRYCSTDERTSYFEELMARYQASINAVS